MSSFHFYPPRLPLNYSRVLFFCFFLIKEGMIVEHAQLDVNNLFNQSMLWLKDLRPSAPLPLLVSNRPQTITRDLVAWIALFLISILSSFLFCYINLLLFRNVEAVRAISHYFFQWLTWERKKAQVMEIFSVFPVTYWIHFLLN